MNYIKEINIFLKTNANTPSEPEPAKDKSESDTALNISDKGYVPLSYSMIVVPPPPTPAGKPSAPQKPGSIKDSQTPYFTNYIRYTDSLQSYLLQQGYREILKFFFNQSHFKTVLRIVGITINPAVPESERNKNSAENIQFMIRLLFPTTFPAYNNMITSYDDIFRGNAAASTATTSLYDFMPKYVKDLASTTNKYSYINIGGGIHTIYRVVVINDIINHPKFNRLIDRVHTFIEDFDKERDGIIETLINRFVSLRDVLDHLESNLQYIHILNQAKQGQMERLTDFKYGKLSVEMDGMRITTNGAMTATDKQIPVILKPILKEGQNRVFFDLLKKALLETVASDEFDSYTLKERKRRQIISQQNVGFQNNAKEVSDTDISKIKDYLKYYEVYREYYQYDGQYTKIQVPVLKNIYYDARSKKQRSSYDNSFGRMRRNETFDVETEAKDLMQQSKNTSNYRMIFEELKSVSFETILTDNTDFNAILRSYVNVEADPDTFLLYLYQSLALLQPQKDTTLTSVFVKDDAILRKLEKDEIEKYCKMTVLNTMDKKEKTKKVVAKSYSVYIQLDLIAGKLDDGNLSDIQCKYKGEQLGNMYRRLSSVREFWEVDPLPYLKLSNILDKPVKTGKVATTPKGAPLVKRSQKRRNPVGQVEGGSRWYKQKYPVRHTRKRHTRVF
jgi:hypothetical protein